MTELEAMCLAMDASPQDVVVIGAAADLLDEMGDPRGPGLRVLWELGKTGRAPTYVNNTQHPGYSYWKTAYGSECAENMKERLRFWWRRHEVIDSEWHQLYVRDHGSKAFDTSTLYAARLHLATLWAAADEVTRLRWLANMTGTPADPRVKEDATGRIAAFADTLGYPLDVVLDRMNRFQEDGDCWGPDHDFDYVDQPLGLWSWYAAVTGNPLRDSESFLSCCRP